MWLVLAAGTCAFGWLTLFYTWNVFDEGFIAKGAALVLHGKLLIRDFLTLYGPAQFYLLASLFAVFGEQLIVVRLWSVLTIALLGLAIYVVGVKLGGRSRTVAVLALVGSFLLMLYRLPSPGYPMAPTAALLLAAAIPLHRFAAVGDVRALGLASTLIGCAGLFRWEQGVFGLVALAGTLLFWAIASRQRTPRLIASVAARAFAPAVAIMAFVLVPWILVAGFDYFVQDVLVHTLRDFKAYRGLDFVRPQLWGVLGAWERGQPGHALLLTIPLVALGATLLAVAATLLRALISLRGRSTTPEPDERATLVMALFLALVLLGMLNQLRVRPEASRAVFTAAAATPLLAYWWHVGTSRGSALLRRLALGVLAVSVAVLAAGAGNSAYNMVNSRETVATQSPHALYLSNPVHEPQYNALIAHVQNQTLADELIYSGVLDHQVLLLNDSMIYFLTGRDGPTRFYEMDPGLANTRQAQEHIAAALEQAKVRLLVLWDLKSTENNLSSRPNGIAVLDNYIRQNYQPGATFGAYQVWMRNAQSLPKVP